MHQSSYEASGGQRIRMIDPELLLQKLRTGERIRIVDVRRGEEFRGSMGRIAGSRSVPFDQLVARSEELDGYRSEPLVVVSSRGERARLAALQLEFAGFTEVRVLDGGLARWVELGMPVVHATIPPGPVAPTVAKR